MWKIFYFFLNYFFTYIKKFNISVRWKNIKLQKANLTENAIFVLLSELLEVESLLYWINDVARRLFMLPNKI